MVHIRQYKIQCKFDPSLYTHPIEPQITDTMNIKEQEYIIKQLNSLYEKFTAIQIRYEFSEGLNVHFVEVLPLEVYDTQNYILEEMRISEKFEEIFGDKEELLFISEESLNKIENPTYLTHSHG